MPVCVPSKPVSAKFSGVHSFGIPMLATTAAWFRRESSKGRWASLNSESRSESSIILCLGPALGFLSLNLGLDNFLGVKRGEAGSLAGLGLGLLETDSNIEVKPMILVLVTLFLGVAVPLRLPEAVVILVLVPAPAESMTISDSLLGLLLTVFF